MPRRVIVAVWYLRKGYAIDGGWSCCYGPNELTVPWMFDGIRVMGVNIVMLCDYTTRCHAATVYGKV